MEVITSHSTLLEKFNATKQRLKEAEKTLRILSGHPPDECSDGYKLESGISHKPQCFMKDRSIKYKRHPVTSTCRSFHKIADNKELEMKDLSQSEESTDEYKLSVKHDIQSAVSKVVNIRSKKEVIHKQNVNSKIETRNRRILGMLQGTLQKFQDEAEKRKSQDLKRKIVEQKVEAAAEDEKKRIKKQKLDLILEKNEKEVQLKILQEMLEATEHYEIWECNQKYLLNFIRTETKPHIYFLPLTHDEKSKKRLEKSKVEVWERIEQHESRVKKQLMEIKESFLLESLQSKQFDSTHTRNKTEENPEITPLSSILQKIIPKMMIKM